MPLPISAKDLVRFTPERLKGRPDAPVFLLKVPTVRERLLTLDPAMAEVGARYPTNIEYAKALRAAVISHVIYDDQPALLQIVDEFEASTEEATPTDDEGRERQRELNERIEEIARVLRQHDLPLGKIEAERTRFLGAAMLVRSELFLVAIEGEDQLPKDQRLIERFNGRLTEASQDAIENRYGNGTLLAIGSEIATLMSPGEDQRKNSPSPPPSLPAPGTSTAESEPPTGRRGKSLGNGTSAIHA